MNRVSLILIIVLMLGANLEINAQGRLGVFVGGGTMWYQGDLKETALPNGKTLGWTANAGLWWQINQRWGMQLNYTTGEIGGDDQYASSPSKQARGLKFQSSIHEIGIRGTYDFLRNDMWPVSPYLSLGVSALNFEPKSDGIALRPLQTEGISYSNWSVAFPMGLGVKYQIKQRWALKLEANYHLTLTDYLDDVSGEYPDVEVPIYTDPGDVSGVRDSRGNPSQNDGLWEIHLGAIYLFTGSRKITPRKSKKLNNRRKL
jgi:opacity protein-like surface antigen